jgi:hypothetical protein
MPINPGQSREAHTQIGKLGHVAASSLRRSSAPALDGIAACATNHPAAGDEGAAAGQPIELAFQAVQIGARRFPFSSFEEISRAYRQTIERLGLGASECPPCHILDHRGEIAGYVSYNGRVWRGAPHEWQSGQRPLYAPDGHYGDPAELYRERAQ